MPFYEYELPDGSRVVRHAKVQDRDSFPHWKRITVPDRVTVLAGNALDPFTESTLKGYYKLEQEQGSRFSSSYTKQQIRDAWAT